MSRNLTSLSKFLSLVLRHNPGTIGITLDDAGWTSVDELLRRMTDHGKAISLAQLQEVVAADSKGRYSFSADGDRIRANQGHSVSVELGYAPVVPPDHLFHGTARRFLDSILREGLLKRNRHHVHLSGDRETAVAVGTRHGPPVVLKIASGRMHGDGMEFFRSENGVWLVDAVPVEYLSVET